jgi:hypothetical protein
MMGGGLPIGGSGVARLGFRNPETPEIHLWRGETGETLLPQSIGQFTLASRNPRNSEKQSATTIYAF